MVGVDEVVFDIICMLTARGVCMCDVCREREHVLDRWRGAGKASFNVATPTYATVTCTAYVLLYNLQTKNPFNIISRGVQR